MFAPRRIAIIGTGLIGGSIGLRLASLDDALEITGYDEDAGTRAEARARGAITAEAPDAVSAVTGAELVVLALPVDRVPQTCWSLGHAVEPTAVITDVGSAKTQAVAEGESVFGPRFVGGHPMAGSERHGIEAADPLLFDDAWWVLTPTAQTDPAAFSTVSDLARSLGAKPVAVGPEVHDTLVARLSHLPQITASALVDLAVTDGEREALLGLAAGGFRDVTRIAASRPEMWVAILRSNRRAVLEALDGFGERLAEVADIISRDRWDDLKTFLDDSRTARLDLFSKPVAVGPADPIAVSVVVPDRPGVLAEVTRAAGEIGVNIEDLRIVHSTEGGRGRLELVVSGAADAEALVGALEGLGYHAESAGLT